MKICIVTVYNSMNCGSYLQAFALMKFLNNKGHEVVFLKTRARRPFRTSLWQMLNNIIKGNYKEALFTLSKLFKFRKLHSLFKECAMNSMEMARQDLFIVGSDEIWNIKRPAFSKYPVFWGKDINNSNIIAYAPSINKSTVSDIDNWLNNENYLRKVAYIGVRDLHTKTVLEKFADKDIALVLDPTMIFDSDFYKQYEIEIKIDNYILLYIYEHKLSSEQIQIIKNFAVSKNLQLVAINSMLDWSDKNYPASPFEFLSFYRNASYVITNTFHGTIFSIIYKKQFITYANDNIKVVDLLERTGLQKQNGMFNDNISFVLEEQIDYKSVYNNINCKRNESMDYLLTSISSL